MVFPSFDQTLNKSPTIDKDTDVSKSSLVKIKRETRSHVLNSLYATPTSLPLYFYFGYQLLQESNSLEKCGDVRKYYYPLSLIFFNNNTYIRLCKCFQQKNIFKTMI